MRQYFLAGESQLIVEFGDTIAVAINRKVHLLAKALNLANVSGLREVVPSYRSLMISYDPCLTTATEIKLACEVLASTLSAETELASTVMVVPVHYGGEGGPDLEDVARETALSTAEVVAIHTSRVYLVYMIGFLPGFPYLGELDARLSLPRLKVPRIKVPAGSVAIAELQTGVYSLPSPGGWRLIGHTPLSFFNPEQSPPCLLQPGQWVSFRDVSLAEHAEIAQSVQQGDYEPQIISAEVGHA